MARTPSRMLAIFLSLALLSAPATSMFAGAGGQGDHHASAHHMSDHAQHAQTEKPGQPRGCAQFEDCDGQCCATCAQCFTAALVFTQSSASVHTVQQPIVPILHQTIVLDFRIRPPQAA